MSGAGQIIVPGFGDLTQDVIRELTSGRLFQEVQARREAKAIAVEEHQAGERRHLKFGRLRMRIPEEAYFYWGLRLGFGCWQDKQFLHEYERDNPECRVRSRPRKCALRVQGLRTAAGQNCLPANNGRAGARGGEILDQFGRAIAPQS